MHSVYKLLQREINYSNNLNDWFVSSSSSYIIIIVIIIHYHTLFLLDLSFVKFSRDFFNCCTEQTI